MNFLSSRLRRIGLAARITVVAMLTLLLGLVALEAWNLAALRDRERALAAQQLERNLGLLRLLVADLGQGWRLDGAGSLFIGDTPLAGRHDVTDRVKAIGGGVATIFAQETRIATSVARPDGTRATGTILDPGAARDAVRRGATFRGDAVILGLPYLTIYEPVRDTAGRQVGILFVGVDLTSAQAASQSAMRLALMMGLVLLVVVGSAAAAAAANAAAAEGPPHRIAGDRPGPARYRGARHRARRRGGRDRPRRGCAAGRNRGRPAPPGRGGSGAGGGPCGAGRRPPQHRG
jgi:methyl-accepting chemotaxis protein